MNRPFLAVATVVALALLSFGGDCNSHKGNNGYDDPNRPNRIPQGADVVREGHGKLKWTADLDGTIFVYDSDKKEIRYEGPVRHGEEVVVHPEEDRIYVATRPVYEQNMEKKDWHKIYFISGRAYEPYR